ncbi:peptidylprolyl isomerase [Macellibacteroides fermentans]|uniref:peptidylprolyl isomerase n=1 Tax=Macellibacteroides fermentans TaxID=879969 RepID=UPI00406D3C6A
MNRIVAAMFLCFSFLSVYTLWGQEKETLVLIDTDMGKIKVKLYNETPQHRDNFVKLINEGRYDGLIFHRIIKQFMVQGGDVTSKDAPIDKPLGDGDLGYTVPAEIVYPKYFHKRGALCAARTGDDTNPERASSATQFYIVTGKFFTDMELDKKEAEEGIKYTPEQREAYKIQGGAPHLDNKYTVFGEVVKGQDVVDEMHLVATNDKDRPLKNIKIKSMKVVTK